MTPWIVIDFETVCGGVDLKKVGSYRYAADPTCEVLCLAYETHARERGLWQPGQPIPPVILRAIQEGWIFVAHNAGFERNIWAQIMEPEYGWPPIPLEQWHDTSARGLQLALPASLDNILRVLELKHQKDTEGSKLTVGLSRPDRKGKMPERTPAVLERVGRYCLTDIDGQVELHRRIGWLSDHERAIWLISQEVNDRGIYLDMEFVEAAQAIVDQAKKPLEAEFREITGVNVGQRDKILSWCSDQGVALADMRKETLADLLDGEEEGDDEQAEDPQKAQDDVADEAQELPPNVRRALTIRQLIGSASIKKLVAMKACVGFDGRARGLMVYHGTTPGRQTAKILQPHNFPKGTLKEDGESPDPEPLVRLIKQRDPEMLEMVYGNGAVEVIVSSLRHALQAQPGRVLLAGDYSGIQARTVLAVAGQHDKTALMAAGADVYCDMAGQIYHRVIDKKKDPFERGVGKNSVLGLGFQMGGKTFFIKYSKGKIDLEFCHEIVRTYRKEWAPLVPELWYALQDAAIDTVWTGRPHETHGIRYRLHDRWLVADFPNGSELRYFNPQETRRAMPWDDTDIRKGFKYNVQKQGVWITRDAFGGQLAENAVMKIEREIMEGAKKRLKANGFPLVLEVHDELVAEPLLADADLKAFVQIMEDVEPWVKHWRIPVAVDAWQGDRYKK